MNQTTIKDHRLTLPEVVDALVAEGLVVGPEAEKFKLERRYFKADTHPLLVDRRAALEIAGAAAPRARPRIPDASGWRSGPGSTTSTSIR